MASLAVDQNTNRQSDVWEMLFQAIALPPDEDMDADGWSNAAESTAGTNPLDAASHPEKAIRFQAGMPTLEWRSFPGKRYTLQSGEDPASLALPMVWLPPGSHGSQRAFANARRGCKPLLRFMAASSRHSVCAHITVVRHDTHGPK